MDAENSYFVQARSRLFDGERSDQHWVAVAGTSDWELANAMVDLVESGVPGYPKDAARGRVRFASDMDPAQAAVARREIAASVDSNDEFSARLREVALERIGQRGDSPPV